MKRTTSLPSATVLLLTALLLNGCIAIGNRDAQQGHGTLGQQLIDLQKARDAGALSDSEYQTQKARLLQPK
jgi:hypothetical protein